MPVKKFCDDFRQHIIESIKSGNMQLEEHDATYADRTDDFWTKYEGVIQERRDAITTAIAAYHTLLADAVFWQESDVLPRLYNHVEHHSLKLKSIDIYIFKNKGYSVEGVYTPDQRLLLVQDCYDSERRKFERLQNKFTLAQSTVPRNERTAIPEEVRIAVWRRDDGRCVRCRSRERLEYDHIIPISRGGSNTVRNIELLCEACNRSKGADIQ